MAWRQVMASHRRQTPVDWSHRERHAEGMSAVFDTHAFVKRLTAVGMPEEQAEALADEQAKLIDERLATKADIALVQADIEALRQATKADIEALRQATKADLAEIKADILKWMFGALLGQAAVIVALVKLL